MERSNARADLTRRLLLKRAGLSAGLVAFPGLLAACGDDDAASGGGGGSGGGSGAAQSGESAELTELLDKVQSKQVIIGNYGGTTEDARKAAFWDSFTERTGAK